MAQLSKAELTKEVRRILDEVTMSGIPVLMDTNMEDTASSNFSDSNIGNRLDRAARYVAARVTAAYVRSLIKIAKPVEIPGLKVMRLMDSRQYNGDIRATRRTFASHRHLQANGMSFSSDFPVYVFEDFELHAYPDPVVDSPANVAYVAVPETTEEMDERLREAIVQRAVYTCFRTLQLKDLADTTRLAYLRALSPYMLRRIKLGQEEG